MHFWHIVHKQMLFWVEAYLVVEAMNCGSVSDRVSSGFLVEHSLLIYCVATDNQLISFCLLYSLCYDFCMEIIAPHNPFCLSLIKKALLDQVRGLEGVSMT